MEIFLIKKKIYLFTYVVINYLLFIILNFMGKEQDV